jgi:excisionase family DNA binding protein
MPDCELVSRCPLLMDRTHDMTEITGPYTVKDVARILHIHVNTARRWSNQGLIKSYRITRRGDRRFRGEDIARFLAKYNDFNMSQASGKEATSTCR